MTERSSNQGSRYTYGTRWGALCSALILLLGFGLASIPGTARAASTTVLTVTNLNDSGAGSLRAAINTANAGGTYDIVFASGLSGTITLTSTLDIADGAIVTIDGGGSIAISGGHINTTAGVRVMSVASGATLALDNITIEDGYVEGGDGGGVDNGGTLTVSNSTFSGNVGYNGGGVYNNGGTVTVTNSTFSNNRAFGGSNGGGGIGNGGTLKVSNSTFSGNAAVASYGGGIDNESSGTLKVSNSTFSGNLAILGGGGAYNNGGTLSLTGTIMAGNIVGDCGGTITDGGYNIATDGSCGFSSVNHSYSNYTTPLFSGGLANNGGPTETIALAPATVAIDAIPAADCPAIDQRDYTRPDGHEKACDIGAYESGGTAPKLQIDTSSGSFDLNSGVVFSGAVDPVKQNVTLKIETYSVTIPAGSFVQTKKGDYVFQGTIGGVSLQVRLVPQADDSYTLQLQGSGADLSGITNPVTVTLTMTDASGNLVATGGISAIASIS